MATSYNDQSEYLPQYTVACAKYAHHSHNRVCLIKEEGYLDTNTQSRLEVAAAH